MKRIICAVDGSDAAIAPVSWSARLAFDVDADLTVMTAFDQEDEDELSLAACLEGPWTAPARDVGCRLTTTMVEGDLRTILPDLVLREDSDLVVIGASTDATEPNRVAHDLLHRLHRPLAVVPAMTTYAGGPVVVGIDGSRASAAALAWAMGLARALHVDVTAVFAHDVLADSFPHADLDNWRYRGEDAVREQVAAASRVDASTPIELVQMAGDPAAVLRRLGEERQAVAVVSGTRGRGGLHGLIIGRVPRHLVDAPTLPVIVVPH